MPRPNVYVLALRIDQAAEQFFTSLRQSYFPKHLNYLNAHVTSFHALSPLDQTVKEIEALPDWPNKAMTIGISDPFLFKSEKGVAINLKSHAARQLHQSLLEAFRKNRDIKLTEQDDQRLKGLHITVCNKVNPERGREVFEIIKKDWDKRELQKTTCRGLTLYEYLPGGSWKEQKHWAFE